VLVRLLRKLSVSLCVFVRRFNRALKKNQRLRSGVMARDQQIALIALSHGLKMPSRCSGTTSMPAFCAAAFLPRQ
jgi:hypothetical protein